MRFSDENPPTGLVPAVAAPLAEQVSRKPVPFLVARHGGRAALISATARLPFCRRARRELHRLGLDGFDWILVTYRMSEEQRRCWADPQSTVGAGS